MRKQLVSVAHREIERRLRERDDQGRCRGEVFGLVKRYELPVYSSLSNRVLSINSS